MFPEEEKEVELAAANVDCPVTNRVPIVETVEEELVTNKLLLVEL